MKRIACAGFCLIALLFPLNTFLAADGRIPIWEPTTITEPGSYVLVRDIDCCDTLYIEADDVDLDLNGFRVDGAEPGIVATNVSGLSIHDGSVVWQSSHEKGISLENVHNASLYRLRVNSRDDYALRVANSSYVVIEDCSFQSTFALYLSGDNFILRNNVVADGSDVQSIHASQVVGNSFYFPVNIGGDGNTISENLFRNGGLRISGDNNLIDRNNITASPGFGLEITGDSNVYRGNTARGNAGTGCTGTASGGDFCDEGTNNTSHGDNYMPGQM